MKLDVRIRIIDKLTIMIHLFEWIIVDFDQKYENQNPNFFPNFLVRELRVNRE